MSELHGLGTLPLSPPEERDHLEPWNRLMNHSSLLLTSESEHQELLWNSPPHISLYKKGNEQLTPLIHFLNSVLPKAKWQCSLVNQGKIYFDTWSFFCQRAFYSLCWFYDIWSLWIRKASYWLWCRVVRESKQGFYKSKELVGSRGCQKWEDEKQFSNSNSILGQMGFVGVRESFSVTEERIVGKK